MSKPGPLTARELYLQAKSRLAVAGIDTPGFDASVLAEHFLGLNRPALALRGDQSPPYEKQRNFLEAVSQRAARRPLQYILGRWPFMSLTLQVGEGVLVPREDTAVLVEALADRLKSVPAPQGLDLCSGTGAVALGLCTLLPGARFICVELDESAQEYLNANLAAYPQYHCRAISGDVLTAPPPSTFSGGLDLIASNPPYIASGELPTLQPEVRCEPALALDGGEDGLLFYRAILTHWSPLLRPGGILGVEIGETQAPAVQELFTQRNFTDIAVHQDLSGLDRVVIGTKPK